MSDSIDRRRFLTAGGAAAMSSGLITKTAMAQQTTKTQSTKFDDPNYSKMPSTDDIFRWIEKLWGFGNEDFYGCAVISR